MYKPSIGDVVLDNNIPMVVVALESNENVGSCSYDRKYLLCEESYMKEYKEHNISTISLEKIMQHGRWVTIYGTKFPEIHKCEDIAPYEIHPIRAYSFRQKEAKTITVYD